MNPKLLPDKKEALNNLYNVWKPDIRTEMVDITEAIGRVTAADLFSINTLPKVRASMADGVAVISERFSNGIPDISQWRIGTDFVRADTGDDFDDRYDAVIRIEDVILDEEGGIKFRDEVSVTKGMNVTKRGNLIKEGDLLIQKGMKIRPTDLAALAIGGIVRIPVYRKPVVAFIPTGSELIPMGTIPERGQNIDSNSIMAKHMLIEMGAQPICYPIVKDSPADLETTLKAAIKTADIVIINGGSSKGAEDFNVHLIKKMGKVICHGIAAAPGKPMCLAVIEGKAVINLPGPSVAAFYGLDWCVRSVVNYYLGLPIICREKIKGILTEDMHFPKFMEFLSRVNVSKNEDGTYNVKPVSFKTSGFASCLSTNALYISKIGESEYRAGDSIEVELLRSREFLKDCTE